VLVLDMIEILPPLGKYKYDTWRILSVKCYIDNSVRLQSCIQNINNDVKDEEEYNQGDEVPFFVNTRRINIVETKISYSNEILYACTDGKGKLVHV
jgi:hypothetical protein